MTAVVLTIVVLAAWVAVIVDTLRHDLGEDMSVLEDELEPDARGTRPEWVITAQSPVVTQVRTPTRRCRPAPVRRRADDDLLVR